MNRVCENIVKIFSARFVSTRLIVVLVVLVALVAVLGLKIL